MKTPVLGLILATAAFAGSSIYLWSQLQQERARADEFASRSGELSARIAELEKARAQFQEKRFASANTFGSGPAAGPGGAPPEASIVASNGESPDRVWGNRRPPERSPAMEKMMRAQMRANNKRMYADIGSQLGLSKDLANKLVDLLTDQQVSGFSQRREPRDETEARNLWEETQARQKAELTDLIGADKVQSLEEYQKTLPARHEVDMLARQFEGYDAPLTDDQRKRLVAVMTEERERVPAPQYVDGTDMEEYQKTRLAWDQDYNDRVSSQARSILNTEQASVYTEYQQAQQEMRAQFATMPGGGRMRGMPGGNVAFSTVAAPAGAAYVDAVIVNAAPAEPAKK